MLGMSSSENSYSDAKVLHGGPSSAWSVQRQTAAVVLTYHAHFKGVVYLVNPIPVIYRAPSSRIQNGIPCSRQPLLLSWA